MTHLRRKCEHNVAAGSLRAASDFLTSGVGGVALTMNYRDRIVIDPQIRSGKPCIRGTRITVDDIFGYLGGGMTVEQILEDFPDLQAEDVQACFAFTADRFRRLSTVPHEAVL